MSSDDQINFSDESGPELLARIRELPYDVVFVDTPGSLSGDAAGILDVVLQQVCYYVSLLRRAIPACRWPRRPAIGQPELMSAPYGEETPVSTYRDQLVVDVVHPRLQVAIGQPAPRPDVIWTPISDELRGFLP